MTEKTFTVAGTSNLNGDIKVRFANDAMRVKVLIKNGHKDVVLIELPEAMTKLDAAKFIQSLPEFQGETEQMVIADFIGRDASKEPKVKPEKPVKEKAVKVKPETPITVETVAVAQPDSEDDNKPIGYVALEAELGMAPF